MAKESSIGVRLEQYDREALERIARAEDRTVAAIARRIIVEWLMARKERDGKASAE